MSGSEMKWLASQLPHSTAIGQITVSSFKLCLSLRHCMLCGMRLSLVIYVFCNSKQCIVLKINIVHFSHSLKGYFMPDWHFVSS